MADGDQKGTRLQIVLVFVAFLTVLGICLCIYACVRNVLTKRKRRYLRARQLELIQAAKANDEGSSSFFKINDEVRFEYSRANLFLMKKPKQTNKLSSLNGEVKDGKKFTLSPEAYEQFFPQGQDKVLDHAYASDGDLSLIEETFDQE